MEGIALRMFFRASAVACYCIHRGIALFARLQGRGLYTGVTESNGMECDCGGILIEGKSCYTMSNDNFFIVIENIPAFQCTRCGKVLFKDEIVDRIKKLTHRIDRETEEIITGRSSIHSYDY
jgi:YgiT-type zinc finger domain-containing protein